MSCCGNQAKYSIDYQGNIGLSRKQYGQCGIDKKEGSMNRSKVFPPCFALKYTMSGEGSAQPNYRYNQCHESKDWVGKPVG